MILFVIALVWFYHVPQLSADVPDDSIHLERERYNYQLGLEAYQKLNEKYGDVDGGF